MKKCKRYVLRPSLSKKTFLLSVLDLFEEDTYPYDIYSIDFDKIQEKRETLLLVRGSAEAEISYSKGEIVEVGDSKLTQFTPCKDKYHGEANAILPLSSPFPKTYAPQVIKQAYQTLPDNGEEEVEVEDKQLEDALVDALCDDKFHPDTIVIKDVSHVGKAQVKEARLVEVTFFETTIHYQGKELLARGLAAVGARPYIKKSSLISGRSKEENDVLLLSGKSVKPGKLSAFIGIIGVLLITFGLPLGIVNLGKQTPFCYFCLAFGGLGIVLFLFSASLLLGQKKKFRQEKVNLLSHYEEIRKEQREEKLRQIKSAAEESL